MTGGRAPGIWAVRKGDHMHFGLLYPDLSPYYIVHFASFTFDIHHADYLA